MKQGDDILSAAILPDGDRHRLVLEVKDNATGRTEIVQISSATISLINISNISNSKLEMLSQHVETGTVFAVFYNGIVRTTIRFPYLMSE
jgi:hypothetical protein